MNLGTLWVTLAADMSQLDKVATGLSSTSQKFRTFGYLASAALTVPMVMAGKAAFQTAKDYEFAIQKIVGLTGEAQSSVNAWSKEILRISPQLAKGPKELAEALYFISSSGVKGAEAMDVLKLSAKAATSGMGSTQEMAQVLTSALNAYRGTGLTASYATDVFVAAVREGKAEAAGFATSMGQIIPIAANLGVSLDQVAGGMAAVTLTGASAANAAVYMKGIFNSLITASSQGEKALGQMGSSYADLRRVLKEQGLVALMQKLRDMQVQYGDELLSDVIPNIRAMTFFMSFAGKNFKYNSELMNRVTNSAGSLGKAFAAVADTIKVRYDRAISSAQVSLVSLGKSITTAILPFIERLSGALDRLSKWFDSLTEAEKRHKLTVLAVVAALGPLSLVISVIGYTISGIISVVTSLTTAFKLLNLTVIANPWLLVGAAAIALVTALVHARNKTKDFITEQSSLNEVLIDVNGELKRMNDLTKVDFSSMSVNALSQAYVKAWDAAALAKKRYDDAVAARKGETKLNAWLKSGKYDLMEEAAYKDWNLAKLTLESISTALTTIATSAKDAKDQVNNVASSLKKLEAYKIDKKFEVPIPDFTDTYKAFGIMGADQSGKNLYSGKWMAEKAAIDSYNAQLMNQGKIVDELTKSFKKFFFETGGGFKGMIDAMLNGLKMLVAEIASKIAIYLLLQTLFPGSGVAVGALTNLRKFVGVPGYANGTNNAPGGWSLVGERGPELVNLPKGSQVLNNLASLSHQDFEPVVFEIKGDTLVGILRKAANKNSLY